MTRMDARQEGHGHEASAVEPPHPGGDPTNLNTILRDTWGHDHLRPLQQQAVEAVLGGRDTLLVLPTGGGKSICYQLPALVSGRPSVVISPLVSLMKDQVDAIRANGVDAAALHGLMDDAERRDTIRRYLNGELALLYLAPERLGSGSLLSILRKGRPGLIAIDEAHCISQWGHDFRPDYRRLAAIRAELPGVPTLACTATATPQVQIDVVEQLELSDPLRLVGSVDRPNLVFRMRPRTGGVGQIHEILQRHQGEASIVYTLSRNDAERIAGNLRERGLDAAHYHAGLSAPARHKVHEDFRHDRLSVVVATVAFGMGIDRGDVRCVVHANMPRSLEHYQQEAGRAGRDGLEAECVLLHSAGDIVRWQRLMEKSATDAIDQGGDPEAIAVSLAAQRNQLGHMARICRSARCRHLAIAEYFGSACEPSASGEGCGACDACLGEITLLENATTVAQMILSCVARVDQSFGAGHVAEILSGGRGERVRRLGHDQLSTWGLLREHGKNAVLDLLEQCVAHGLLSRTPGDRPVLVLTPEAIEILRGNGSVDLVRPATRTRQPSTREADDWRGIDRPLFDGLRDLRRTLARERSVPAYVIASDAVLRELARLRPASLETLGGIRGIGQRKLVDYGPQLLGFLDSWCTEHGLARDMAG